MANKDIFRVERRRLSPGETDPGLPSGLTQRGSAVIRDLGNNGSRLQSDDHTKTRILTRFYTDATTLADAGTASLGIITPVRLLMATPAGYIMYIHEDMFDNGTHNKAIFSNMQADGGDVRIATDAAGQNTIPFQLTEVDTTPGAEKLRGWVYLQSALSIGDYIRVVTQGAGGSLTQPAATDPLGRNAVFQEFDAAYNDLDIDSSGNLGNATHSGSLAVTTGLLNGLPARGFGIGYGAGGPDYTTLPYTGNPTAFTLSALVYEDATFNNTFPRILEQNGGSAVSWIHNWNGETNVSLGRTYSGAANWKGATGARGQWRHVMVTLDSSDPTNDAIHYEDGVALASTLDSNSSGALQNNAVVNWMVGNRPSDQQRVLKGLIGCLRIRPSVAPASWAAVESANFSNPASVATAEALS